MLSKALRIVPLLALGAVATQLQQARDAAVPVEQVRAIGSDQDYATLASRQGLVRRPGPGKTNRCTKPPIKRRTKRVDGGPLVPQMDPSVAT